MRGCGGGLWAGGGEGRCGGWIRLASCGRYAGVAVSCVRMLDMACLPLVCGIMCVCMLARDCVSLVHMLGHP